MSASVVAWLVAGWLAVVNVAGFVVFWRDKRAAIAGRWRVPERVLFTFAALGAWPAILGGAEILRHKTRKQPFRAILYTIIALQFAAIVTWFTLVP
ncbi:DUF1294 domain-containing protein [Acuticoccus sp. I52.16.1]|uniref:DUF1294 domain-containing protein n=1 Tax=Acuticoccus sp. I52.16.1 TaxID=2928472 RepID=UPI001FD5E313|nr:DUF1294 domain-containing protein [Acuticoccus sp. I52.16.1]UOM34956.1 DUF1294 domain-containing protein [Acuticoccus sp. I52.16.1]